VLHDYIAAERVEWDDFYPQNRVQMDGSIALVTVDNAQSGDITHGLSHYCVAAGLETQTTKKRKKKIG